MRLTPEQLRVIKMAVQVVDTGAEVKLFGSRVNDEKKGGDIDLLINSNKMGWRDVAKLRQILEKDLGEQKIDIVLKSSAEPSFVEMIETDAIRL